MADNTAYDRGVMYLQTVAKTPDGAKALAFLIENYSGLFTSNFSGDAAKDAYYNGQRSVFLMLKELLGDSLFYSILQTKY